MIIRMVSLFLLAVFSSNIYAVSKSPFPDGKVEIKIIDNVPCMYINKSQLSGWYVIMVSMNDETGNLRSWHYENSFEDHYPTESKCVMLNSSNFKNLKLIEHKAYFIEMIPNGRKYDKSSPPPSFDGFSSRICLKQNDKKQLQIQDYIYGQCMDKEPKTTKVKAATDTDSKSWFERLLGWFKSL